MKPLSFIIGAIWLAALAVAPEVGAAQLLALFLYICIAVTLWREAGR